MTKVSLYPLFPWVGGKQKVRNKIHEYFPKDDYVTYIEPFIGGGSLFLLEKPNKAFINDINPWIIMIWHLCSHHPEFVITHTSKISREYTPKTEESYFFKLLEEFNEKRASLEKTIPSCFHTQEKCKCSTSLLKTAYNYFVLVKCSFGAKVFYDKHGILKCHYGNQRLSSICTENFLHVHSYLTSNDITMYNGDYRKLLKDRKEKCFFYLDPPYHDSKLEHNIAKYHETKDFLEREQIQLQQLMVNLSKRHFVLQSNSCTPFIRK